MDLRELTLKSIDILHLWIKSEKIGRQSHEDLHTLMTTSAANVGNNVIVPVVAVVVLVTTVLYRRYL
jgi:hypothetical protein